MGVLATRIVSDRVSRVGIHRPGVIVLIVGEIALIVRAIVKEAAETVIVTVVSVIYQNKSNRERNRVRVLKKRKRKSRILKSAKKESTKKKLLPKNLAKAIGMSLRGANKER